MMGSTSSAAEAAKTEATNQPKKTGPKREKSRAQKDAHNANCRKSRVKLKAANEEWMRQILTTWNFNSVEWFASQSNMQVGQASGTRIFQDFNEIEELGMTGTENFLPSNANFYQQIGFGPDYANITASAAGTSSVANHAWSCVFDAPNNDGVLNNSAVGSSFDANQDLPVFGVPNNHDNLSTHNPATGFLTPTAAAGFSFAANHDMPTVFDASNNSDLFTTHHKPDAGYK
ncbi:hypothetical protein REPUB_Repub07fG0176200 [Reevesia pubescens]